MDEGILLLRATVALVLLVHAAQKSIGWFSGHGYRASAIGFGKMGLRPGAPMVIVATVMEAASGVSLLPGFLTQLGAAAGVAAMTVAGVAASRAPHSVWHIKGGGEFAFVMALVLTALCLAGAGRFSIDALIPWESLGLPTMPWPWSVGLAIALFAAAGATVFLAIFGRRRVGSVPPASTA